MPVTDARTIHSEILQWMVEFGQPGYLGEPKATYKPDGNMEKMNAEVAIYLSDGKRVAVELATLDNAMRVLGQDKEPVSLTPVKHRKILTSVLSENEIENFLNRSMTISGFADPDVFRLLISDKIPTKDPTVPFEHGEFTHRIQWYCVMKNNSLDKTRSALGIRWCEYYAWVGDRKHSVNLSKKHQLYKEGWEDLGMWDAVFDRNPIDRKNANGPYNTDDIFDFRSPENLHRELIARKATLKMLSEFIEMREKKRELLRPLPGFNSMMPGSQEYNDEIARLNAERRKYLVKSRFGPVRNYDQLSADEKNIINTLMDKPGGYYSFKK